MAPYHGGNVAVEKPQSLSLDRRGMSISDEMRLFIYLLEKYAAYKGVSAGRVLKTWDQLGLSDYVYDMCEMYCSEAIENAFADIDRKTAWAMQRAFAQANLGIEQIDA